MKRAPFVRLIDKISFIFGVLLIISAAFMLGRYPNNYFYLFHVIMVTTLVLIRLYNYKKKGWHYYLLDFCYFANAIIIVFLFFTPKNEIIFKAIFVFTQGTLSMSIAAFRNSMIFHKIDNLVSLAIHLLPMLTVWNIKWCTLEYEKATIKDINQRYFLTLDENESWFSFVMTIFIYPILIYLFWVVLYYLKIFVISRKKI